MQREPPRRVGAAIAPNAPLFDTKLEKEEELLDALVTALARGQLSPETWQRLHDAAVRDERVSELAFAYEAFAQNRKLKTLAPAVIAELMYRAATFFADVFGDALGGVTYLERALAALPTHTAAFDKMDALLTRAGDFKRLGEMYVVQAQHRGKSEQLGLLRRAAELVEMQDGGEERAVEIHQQILRLDPGDVRAREALEEKYLKANRHRDVARLLEQALATEPLPEESEQLKMRGRLLELYATQLHEPERTMPHVEVILAKDPAHDEARKIAAKLVAIKGLAARAAAALADAHEKAGTASEVARYLTIELEHTRGPKRREVLTRLGTLKQDRLNDAAGAYEAFEQALALDPSEDDLRIRYVTLSLKLGKALDAARTLSRVGTVAKDAHVRARLSAEMGELLAAGGDMRRARATFISVLSTPSADATAVLKAARALAEIHQVEKDWKALADVLDRIAEAETDPEKQRRANVQLAELASKTLHDTPRAIAAWRKLVDTSSRARALEELEPLYEITGASADLAFVLEERSKDARDPIDARQLAFRAAEVLTNAADFGQASAAWKRIVEKFGAARDVHAPWMPLLEAQRQWPELAEALSAEAQLAPESERAAIYARLGTVRLQRTRETDAAIDAFKRALAIDAGEKTSRASLEKLLLVGDHRLAAAAVLEPLYRAEDSSAGLVRVLDLKAQLSEDVGDRLAALREVLLVAEASTQERSRAIEFAARGLSESVEHGAPIAEWLARIDKLAESGVDPKRLATLLGKALGDRAITTGDLLDLAKRVGEAHAASGDVASALDVYRRALDFEPSSSELVSRVDELLREQGNPAERVELYRAALARGVIAKRRRELLHAIGTIEREDLGNFEAAIEAYEAAIAGDPDDREAHAALVVLLTETEAWERLCERLEARLARTEGAEAVAIRAQLADVAAAHAQPERAAIHARALLAERELQPSELDVVARIAETLNDVSLARAVLERRASEAQEPKEQIPWLMRLGAMERDRASDPEAAANAWKRAATIAESGSDDALARDLYEMVRSLLPRDREATKGLVDLLERAEAWKALPELYEVLVAIAPSDAEAVTTLMRAARTLSEKLGDAPRATAAAERAFLLVPRDRDALTMFERLATASGESMHFARIVEDAGKRLDETDADTAAVRADLSLARARALAVDPASRDEAIAAYRVILELATLDEARLKAALGAFETLLTIDETSPRTSDWRWLFAWRVSHADEGERVAAMMAWAAAEETRLLDEARALEIHREVLGLDPENADAMTAVARLALALGHVDEAVSALLARRDRSEGAAKSALDLEIAAVLIDRGTRLPEALACIASVLESAPHEGTALALAARLLVASETRATTIALLERTLESVEDAEVRAQVLTRLLDTPADAASRELRRGWFERLLDLESSQGNSELALATVLRAAEELPTIDSLWDRAEGLARELHRPDEVAALYQKSLEAPLDRDDALALGKRAVSFHEEWFEDSDRVVRILERILEIDPAESWAFDRLKLLFDSAERWDDLFALFDRALASAVDAKRIELLEDAAQIAKDFANRSERAIGYLEQLLALKPNDVRLSASLERLYERHDRHRELVTLLTARLGQLPPKDAQTTRARIASLWLDPLGDAAAALVVVEEILSRGADPSIDVPLLLERILAIAPPHAELRDSSSREPIAPLTTTASDGTSDRPSRASVPPSLGGPKRTLVRQRAASLLKDRYVEAGRDADLVRVLEVELEAIKSVKERIRRHTQIAEIYANLGSDAEALEHYVALVLLEPDVLAHRTQLAKVALRTSRQDRLAEVLVAAADDCTDDALRVDLLMHAGAVHELDLGDASRAIDLFFRVLAISNVDKAHLEAARKLAPLLEVAGRSRERLDVLERIATLEPEPEGRKETLGAIASLAADLGEHERAITAWRMRLREDPVDGDALAGLIDLLARERRWRPLLEVLAQRAESDVAPAARRVDRVRIAEILSRELNAVDEAITAWQEVERTFGESEESTKALVALLESAARWRDLAVMLERTATRAGSPEARAELLCDLGDVQREQLFEVGAAIKSYQKALEVDPASARARRGLEALLTDDAHKRDVIDVLLGVYAATDEWRLKLDLTEHRVASADDDDARMSILRDAAKVAEERASDLEAAFGYMRRAFLLAPHEEEVAGDLARLAESTQKWRALADAQREALDAAESRGASAWRVKLRFAMGDVLESKLDDPRAALGAYLRVVAESPGNRDAALAAIRAAGHVMRWDAAANVVVDVTAVAGDLDPALTAAIEEAAASPMAWDAATSAFAAAIEARSDLATSTARALEAKLAEWHRERRGDPDPAEAAYTRALAHEPMNAELLGELAKLQRRVQGRPLVDSLLRLSQATGGDLDLLREAAEVASSGVGDRPLAKSILDKLRRLAIERWVGGLDESGPVTTGGATSPSDHVEWALAQLVRIHEEEGDPERITTLLEETARLPFPRERSRAMRHEAAFLAGDKLGDAARATALYRALFEDDPEDHEAVMRLVDLLEANGQKSELLAVRRAQVAVTKETGARIALRLEVARLEDELGEAAKSIATLRASLAEDPRHDLTARALVRLLQREGKHADLVALLTEQAQREEDAGETRAAADLWANAARVDEEDLDDLDAAAAHHERVIALEPRATSLDALARLAADRGAWGHAAAHLEALLRVTSGDALSPVTLRLADALVAAGDGAAARARLEATFAADPDAKDVASRLSAIYRENRELGALADLLTRSAAHAPDKATRLACLREAADLHRYQTGTPEAAIPLLEQASDLDPDDRAIRLALADALGAAKRYAEARSLLRALVDGFAGRRPKERAPVHYHLARLDLAMGDRAQALVELDAATRIDPANPEILRALAELARDDGQLERAERSYRALLAVLRRVENPPEDAGIVRSEVLLELHAIAVSQNENERATELLESALEAAAKSDVEARRLEKVLRARGDRATLARALEARVSRATDDESTAAALSELADEQSELGETEAALTSRLRAVSLAPQSPAIHAAALAEARKMNAVNRYVAHVTSLATVADTSDREELACDLLLRVGALAEEDGDDLLAAKHYERAQRFHLRLPDVLRALDRVYERLGDTSAQARVLAKRIDIESMSSGSANTDAIFRLATLKLMSADTLEEGCSLFETAIAVAPLMERAEAALEAATAIHPHERKLIDIYEKVGRSEGRERALVRALTLRSELPGNGPAPLREAVEIARGLRDVPLAESLLRRIIGGVTTSTAKSEAPDPEDLGWALTMLAELREDAGDVGDAVALKRQAADLAEPDAARKLRFEVAKLAAERLNDLPLAAATYENLHEHEPADREAWEPLLDVYRRMDKKAELAALIARVVDYVDDNAERSRLRLERVRALDMGDEAGPLLREIVDDDPTQVEAAILLAGILEREGREEELADLLARQLDAAKDRSDAASIASLSLRLGGILEKRSFGEARVVYYGALDWEPNNRAILRELSRLLAEEPSDRADVMDRLLAIEEGEDASKLAIELAALRTELGDDAAAQSALEKGYRAHPASATLRERLEGAYRAREAWDKLAELFVLDAGSKSTPAEKVARLREAATLWRTNANDPVKAAVVLREARAAAPEDAELLGELVATLSAAGDKGGATLEITLAIDWFGEENAASAPLLGQRASIRHELGDDDGALADLEHAYKLAGPTYAQGLIAHLEQSGVTAYEAGDVTKWRSLRMRLAELLAETNAVDDARALLADLLKRDAKDRDALRALARLEEAQERWDAASATYRRLVALEEGELVVETALRLADACERAGRLGDARGGLERARIVAPGDETLMARLERLYEMTGAFRELADLYLHEAKGTRDVARRFASLVRAGSLLLQHGADPNSAIAPLREANALRPGDLECTARLAEGLALAGRAPEATELLNGVLASHKGRRSRELAVIHQAYARVAHALGDRPSEVQWLTSALDMDAQNGNVASELALAARETGNLEVAQRALRTVTMLKSPAPLARALAYQYLGEIARQQGDVKRAVMLLKRAVDDDPNLASARALLASLKTE